MGGPLWLHGILSRTDAEAIISNVGQSKEGCFLIRESKNLAGALFVLSAQGRRGIVHREIGASSTGNKFSFGRGPSFDSLEDLVSHYRKRPLNEVGCTLTDGCGQDGVDGGISTEAHGWETTRPRAGRARASSNEKTWTFRSAGKQSFLSMSPSRLTSTSETRKYLFWKAMEVKSVYLQRVQYFEARSQVRFFITPLDILMMRPVIVFALSALVALVLAVEGGRKNGSTGLTLYWVAGWAFCLLPLISMLACLVYNKFYGYDGHSLKQQMKNQPKLFLAMVFLECLAFLIFIATFGLWKRCDNQDEPYHYQLTCPDEPYEKPDPIDEKICDDDMCDDKFSSLFRAFIFFQLIILILALTTWRKFPQSLTYQTLSSGSKTAWFTFFGPSQHGFPVQIMLAGDTEQMQEVGQKLFEYLPDTLLRKPVTDMLQVTGSVDAAPSR